jgi:hypothetical protein
MRAGTILLASGFPSAGRLKPRQPRHQARRHGLRSRRRSSWCLRCRDLGRPEAFVVPRPRDARRGVGVGAAAPVARRSAFRVWSQAGLIFWFMRKSFSGSYWRLSLGRRLDGDKCALQSCAVKGEGTVPSGPAGVRVVGRHPRSPGNASVPRVYLARSPISRTNASGPDRLGSGARRTTMSSGALARTEIFQPDYRQVGVAAERREGRIE